VKLPELRSPLLSCPEQFDKLTVRPAEGLPFERVAPLKFFSKSPPMTELSIIQKTYDLIRWYIPHLNKLSREHKFALGERITQGLYGLLEALIRVRFAHSKAEQLQAINTELDVLRYQTRLLFDVKCLLLCGRQAFTNSIELAVVRIEQPQNCRAVFVDRDSKVDQSAIDGSQLSHLLLMPSGAFLLF
jgi:hypothetical protein